ncbi:hypothetical protein [Agrococcus casei]|uniref:hypothetical protein n=1 Tax=Agrococcus casei TaxID=343512 RepID=UPI003F916A73
MSESLPKPESGDRPFDVAGASGPRRMLWQTVVPVWLFTIAQVVVILVFTAATAGIWLPIAFGLATLLAFMLQLAVPTTPGHVARLGWAIGGSFVVLAIPTAAVFLTVPQVQIGG